jgi:nucleoporin SEH1
VGHQTSLINLHPLLARVQKSDIMTHPYPEPPPPSDEKSGFDLNLQHGHKDLVQAVAFNTYGDRCATGSVDGKIRVFNRHKDGMWRICDNWTAHGGEILEVGL